MDKSLLIAIFVPTTDEIGEDIEGKHGVLATGYPIGKDLILTAGYILKPVPPYYRDKRYPIRICWHCTCPGDLAGWTEVSDENIVWPSQDDQDTALIRCSLPGDPVVPGIVSHDRSLSKVKWIGEGFPGAAQYITQQQTNSFSGNGCFDASNGICFDLTVGQGPKKENDWKGIRGMPVFVGRKILGVVRSDLPNFKAKKLAVTPTWRLLDDEAFRKAIGCDDKAVREEIKSELVEILGSSSVAVESLIKQKQLKIDDDIVGLDDKQRANCLAGRLLEIDIRTLVPALFAAHHSLCEDKKTSEQQTKAAEILTKVAQRLVPVRYDYGVVQWVRNQQWDDTMLMPLPACIKTVAEIIMAGVDKRATRFRHRTSEHDQPEGELSLPQLPECGIDSGRNEARGALQNHLSRKFNPEEKENFRRVIDDYLLVEFPRPKVSGEPERTREQQITLTADLLEGLRTVPGQTQTQTQTQTYYMLFYLPEDADGQSAMRALIQSCQSTYHAIMFPCLDGSFEQERQDRAVVDSFCRMLPLNAEVKAPSSQPALQTWREKLTLLEIEEAKAADPSQKFKIQQDIAEAKAKIRELGGSI